MRDKLYEAIDKGWGDKIKELVEEYGENSLHKYNGWSPLHHATQSKCFNLDIIKYLIEKCPYAVNFQDNASCTPFHNAVKLAASKSKSEDIEIQQQTVEAVKYMRPYASTETIIDNTINWDFTLLELAANSGNQELIALISLAAKQGELGTDIMGNDVMNPEE